uniref:WG repeat-containing protein n=1 Tax=Strongyloides venezuelensis TaxID=75913 RepID=A0A0K0FY16_STRVS
MRLIILIALFVNFSFSYLGENFWTKVYYGVPDKGHKRVMFNNHPINENGLVDENNQLAYFVYVSEDYHEGFFGMTYLNNGSLCGRFNINNTLFETCENFRILKHRENDEGVFEIIPVNELDKTNSLIEFYDIYAALLIDPSDGSSFYGYISKEGYEAFGIEHRGGIVNYVGYDVINNFGKYIIYRKQ